MKKILIVEDEAPQRILYNNVLKKEGYEIETAANYSAAMRHANAHTFDLAVVDLRLGEESGFEAIQEILNANKETKIVIHTAYADYKQDLQSWSADAYVVKSSDPTELLKTVHHLLDH